VVELRVKELIVYDSSLDKEEKKTNIIINKLTICHLKEEKKYN
jgi:hypothetical protein